MYLFERFSWRYVTESAEDRCKSDDLMISSGANSHSHLAKLNAQPDSQSIPLNESASSSPAHANSLYSYGENFIDVRAAFQEDKRGLITFGFLSIGIAFNLLAGYVGIIFPVKSFIFGTRYSNPWDFEWLLTAAFTVSLCVVFNYFFWRKCWSWFGTEIFTHRHIVARFNRVTRQVHLNRPEYAGGIVTLPWDAVVAAVNPDDEEYTGIGGVLILGFMSEQTGAGYDEMMMLGRPMSGNAELVGFWEYIRRYMEEGPDSVPRPKRLLKLHPFTFEPLRAALRFMSFTWRDGSKIGTLVAGTLLSPLIALLAFCHWVSLLLCYQPRWPEIIEEAGQPGKPIPKLTVAEDFGPEIAARLRANCEKDRADRPLPPFKRRSFKTSDAA